MAVFMELPVSASFRTNSRASLCLYSSKCVVYGYFFQQVKFRRRWRSILKPVRMSLSSEKHFSSNGYDNGEVGVECVNFWGDSEFVEVIGIGSRNDAILDFCIDSPFQSSSLRFWNILMKDAMKVQLQQRFLDKDMTPRIIEASLSIKSCSKAIILVASAGYGLDHIAAIDIMNTIRSANGYAIAIVLKPFSFEGRKRQDEVKDLVEKLQKHANFFVDIDTDKLLQKELVTLDEALKTANNAVLLAINAISVLISELHKKHIDLPHNNIKEVKFPELIKILECYKEAKIGFGAAHDIKTSIVQAIFDCPFLSAGIKDMNGVVICILATSSDIENIDVLAFLHTFRQTAEYTKEIIISTICEPNLEPNLLLTTVVILGNEQLASQKSSILSKLAERFPFVFNLLRRHHQQSDDAQEDCTAKNPRLSKVINIPDSAEILNKDQIGGTTDGLNINSQEPQMKASCNYDEIYASRDQNNENEESDFQSFEASAESSNFYGQSSEGTLALQREQLVSWNLGPGYQIAQEWAKERAADFGPLQMHDNQSIFCLPVGIRSSKELKDGSNNSNTAQCMEPEIRDDMKTQLLVTPSVSWDALSDAGFEAVKVFYDSASTLLKGKYVDPPKKQGVLSVRAASMLEAERDSPKKWNPIVEIQFRGGVYRGRCQGGLPEGKGRLTLGDGSIYDGMWRCGKRSGSGTFYFSNGDVFQGSWRDDLMHGKGWFYFHNGDRWFANFWKGKANGEGRFYSKIGDIFFGHFRDGWRHGRFLCIDVDGARHAEIWDEGVLVSREQLELDSDAIAS